MSTQTLTLHITGMSCGHCVRAVREALEETPGVTVEDVQVGQATVSYDDAETSPVALVNAINEAGYDLAETV